MLDVRIPIGLLFIILGMTLVVFGCVSGQLVTIGEMRPPMHVNLNSIWGLFMASFGLVMSALAYSDWSAAQKKDEPDQGAQSAD